MSLARAFEVFQAAGVKGFSSEILKHPMRIHFHEAWPMFWLLTRFHTTRSIAPRLFADRISRSRFRGLLRPCDDANRHRSKARARAGSSPGCRRDRLKDRKSVV